jgi:hypothetical protein
MILSHINTAKPIAAFVAFSAFDDEPVAIPIAPLTQALWNFRAVRNVKIGDAKRKNFVELN